jgi:alpha-tubulin suppressor-like RCC1 family protein
VSGARSAEALRGANGDKSLAWTEVSAGVAHSCAVRSDGAAFCWGANDRGQLGDGALDTPAGAVRVSLADPIASVSAGQSRSCARTTSNAVYCWGATWTSRDGIWEMSRTQPIPEAVPGAPLLGTVSVGGFTTCGSDPTGAAYCWEANPRGEMGVGANTGSVAPIRVASGVALSHVSAGMLQSCGVADSGAAFCWGDDSFGQLGVPAESLTQRCDQQKLVCSTVPVQVTGSLRFVQISAGLGSHTCGVTIDGGIACWGLGVSGQRGDGNTTYVVSTPTLVRAP